MSEPRLVAIVLIVAGILALIHGGFSDHKDTTVAKVGSIELSAEKTEIVDIPSRAGIGAIVVGGVLPVAGGKQA